MNQQSEIKLNKEEAACLRSLDNVPEEGWAKFFSAIAQETKIPKKKVRCIVRRLERKGLAQYVRGLLAEDGSPGYFGSGYAATMLGIITAKQIRYNKKI